MKRFLLAIGLVVWLFSAQAHEHYIIQHYSIVDGMSQNTVMAILQDQQGFMWFGTWDGLNRFDGYTFEVFKAMNDGVEARVNNRVVTIYEDEAERICVLCPVSRMCVQLIHPRKFFQFSYSFLGKNLSVCELFTTFAGRT